MKQILYADDSISAHGDCCKLQRLVIKFGRLCGMRKSSANVGNNKTRRETADHFSITLNGAIMEEVYYCMCFGVNIDKDDSMKSEMTHKVSGCEHSIMKVSV